MTYMFSFFSSPPFLLCFIFIFIYQTKNFYFIFFFSPSNYLPFQHSFYNSNPPFFSKQNHKTFQLQQTFQNKKNFLFYLKFHISKQITKPLTPLILFKTNNTFFTSDFLFFLFPFFQYSSDAVVTNNEIY